jgi:hypothetical protein
MKFCPHCGTDLSGFLAASVSTPSQRPQGKYDPVKTWRFLLERANACQGNPPDTVALASQLADQISSMFSSPDPVKTIIHVAFDRKIVPEGGALYMATMSNGQGGPRDLNYFKIRGYLIDDDKVRVQDDVPVGVTYGALDYWGGAKQHPRWHMAEPIKLNASRNGEPYFMDENMLAFGVTWKDSSRVGESFAQLFETLKFGIKGGGSIAIPLAVEAIRTV